MPGVSVTKHKASPLVGEVGGGRPASAGQENLLSADQTADATCSASPPNPPHKGEGFKRQALAPDAIARARDLRRRMTEAERVLWRALRDALPGHHWRKQVPLGPYYADFASHSAKLVIEVDGGQHASAVERDEGRTRFLESQGFRVLRFWNNDVLGNTDGVLQSIARVLEASPLVGEVGGGPAASAAEKNPFLAFSPAAAAENAPPPNPPHKGEGLKGPTLRTATRFSQ